MVTGNNNYYWGLLSLSQRLFQKERLMLTVTLIRSLFSNSAGNMVKSIQRFSKVGYNLVNLTDLRKESFLLFLRGQSNAMTSFFQAHAFKLSQKIRFLRQIKTKLMLTTNEGSRFSLQSRRPPSNLIQYLAQDCCNYQFLILSKLLLIFCN